MTDAYKSWNDKLAAYFFNENMAGREVLLYASFDLIEEVGSDLGGIEGFTTAVKTGPSWIRNGDLCVKADKLFQTWKFDRSGNYPPYIAYLVSFVLANYIEGDFDANAYYPRLKTLLRLEHESNASHCFDKMYVLWDDLEKWSKEDREDELGSFTARVRGGKWHVGLPLSQTLLSKEERDHLPLIFRESCFEPARNQWQSNILFSRAPTKLTLGAENNQTLLRRHQNTPLAFSQLHFGNEAWTYFSYC
jgi:hypothetical protein